MRLSLLAGLVLVVACHDATAPVPTLTGVPGSWAWSGTGLPVATINATLTVRSSDGVIQGNWSGRPTGCAATSCDKAGIVFAGQALAPDSVTFGLTATNGTFSISFAGHIVGSQMIGIASSFQNAVQSAPVAITLTRAN